jgi:hypothetical protein
MAEPILNGPGVVSDVPSLTRRTHREDLTANSAELAAHKSRAGSDSTGKLLSASGDRELAVGRLDVDSAVAVDSFSCRPLVG